MLDSHVYEPEPKMHETKHRAKRGHRMPVRTHDMASVLHAPAGRIVPVGHVAEPPNLNP